VKWDSFFFYLNRVNAVLFALILIGFAWAFLQSQYGYPSDVIYSEEGQGFGSEREKLNSIIGQDVDTRDGTVVAYYESDEQSERKEMAGLVLVNPLINKSLTIASAQDEYLVDFNFLYDQGDEKRPVIGYIATVTDEAGFEKGEADLIIGALPAMTKTNVAEDVLFLDLPQVRSDGSLAVIMWPNQDQAELVAFRLNDGSVIDRAIITVPRINADTVSQGPGKAMDIGLLRQNDFGKFRGERLRF